MARPLGILSLLDDESRLPKVRKNDFPLTSND
jgi:myosin heavy subunit